MSDPISSTRQTDPEASADPSHARYRRLTRWVKGLTFVAVAWCLFLVALLIRGTGPADERATVPSPEVNPDNPTTVETSQDGPWGQLTCVPIRIRPVLEMNLHAAAFSSEQVEWVFPDIFAERFSALLTEIDLSEPVREKLLQWAEPDESNAGFVIRPPREFVLGLSPKDRAALYTAIEQYSPNRDQQSAFRFCGDSLDEWIGDAPLADETRALVEPLLYRHGTHLFFADLRSIEQSLPSESERTALIDALACEATFLVRLEIPKDADLEDLIEYWGRGGRQDEVRPILESIASREDDRSIDVTYLLPAFARERIYTYPTSPRINARHSRDCHWTAMNFFSREPDDRFGNVSEVVRCITADFDRVSGSPQLGDIFTIFSKEGQLIHSAVYIADDVLFTKNGASTSRPWMFMKKADMETYYPLDKGQITWFFRRKGM